MSAKVAKSAPPRRPRLPVALVLGEDHNDREALRHLIRALAPTGPTPKTLREPQVLIKGRAAAEQRKQAGQIAKAVGAHNITADVKLVVAHEDADAVEPAHEPASRAIETRLADLGVPVVAAVPAWELETWWYLWPKAVAAVQPGWRPLGRRGTHVGLIENAKETLRRELRPTDKNSRVPDYAEADSARIAEKVCSLGLIDAPEATSHSFERFRTQFRAASGAPAHPSAPANTPPAS